MLEAVFMARALATDRYLTLEWLNREGRCHDDGSCCEAPGGLRLSLPPDRLPRGQELVVEEHPGIMDTAMTQEMPREVRERIVGRTPLGRLAKVQEVARAVTFLLSPLASGITGQTNAVDCGLSAV